MAVIAEALTTLATVKSRLNITVNDYDALLESYINRASILIKDYFGISLRRTERTEPKKPTNTQWLTMDYWPIQAIAYIKFQGTTLTPDTDYSTAPQDWTYGKIYRELCWTGNYYTTGIAYTLIASKREYEIKYTAGFYLPGDVGYTLGAENSLPLTVSDVCELIVSNTFRVDNEARQGIKGTSQGGISYTYITGSDQTHAFSAGIDDILAGKLNLALAKRPVFA